MAQYDEFGREIPDPRPVEVGIRMGRSESLTDQIKRLVREQLSQVAAREGLETLEEADDFDVEDEDGEFLTAYEVVELPLVQGDGDATFDPKAPPEPPTPSASPAPPAPKGEVPGGLNPGS